MKKVKIKFRIRNIVLLLIIIILCGLIIYWLFNKRISNIYVTGNYFYEEQTIIDMADLKYYPKRSSISKNKIIKQLEADDFIKKANVSISLLGSVNISIQEYRLLVYDEINQQYLLDDGHKVDVNKNIMGIPHLMNTVDQDVYDKFIRAFNKIDDDILKKISEIKYDKNEIDNERFLLLMNDERYVYVTLTKITNINNYDDIVESLDGKYGILYLDSGNHFVIKDR